MSHKYEFAHTLTEVDNRLPASMSDCERYGMTWGCDMDCPVLLEGKCKMDDPEAMYKMIDESGYSDDEEFMALYPVLEELHKNNLIPKL